MNRPFFVANVREITDKYNLTKDVSYSRMVGLFNERAYKWMEDNLEEVYKQFEKETKDSGPHNAGSFKNWLKNYYSNLKS